MAEVVLEQVRKTFGAQVVAVDDVSLRVADGEFIVLVGPSGCGKTTTLRMIAGLETPTSGTIRIGDRVVNRVPPRDRDIAMVFQDYALYPHMTVRKNLGFGLKMRKIARDEVRRRVEETAKVLGVTELLDRKPAALSGGQQQRVALGRAIVREPACYLFDEPLSNLDARLRLQMRAELKSMHRGRLRTTAIYVTHDQEEAMTLGDRVVVMAEGRIQQAGPPLEVYQRPANRFVAGFLGAPSMNFIEGTIERTDGRLWFADGSDIRLPVAPADLEVVESRIGAPIVVGLRPEQLRLANGADEVSIGLDVVITEPLGDRTDIYARSTGGTELIARVEAGAAPTGGRAAFTVDPESLHFFEVGAFGRHLRFGG